MTAFRIGAVVCSAVAIAVAIVFVVLLHRPPSTDCDGVVAKAAVLDLVKEKSRLPGNTDYELDSIREIARDGAAGTVTCEAKVFGAFNNAPYSSAPLTYTVSRQSDGQVIVGVKGISGLTFP